MTLSPTEPPPSTGSSLEQLHKMSRTAGLGTTDYVAVNTTAVTTLILGLLSGLSLLATILLVLPVATVIVGLIAILQIRRSSGTQSGFIIAALGLLVAIGFVGVVGGKEVIHQRKVAVEQRQITSLIEQFGQSIAAKDYPSAWNDFSERVREKSSEANFADLWARIQGSSYYGVVQKIESNGIVQIAENPDTGVLQARGVTIFTLADGKSDRREAVFSKTEDGKWEIEDVQGLTPPPLKPTAP